VKRNVIKIRQSTQTLLEIYRHICAHTGMVMEIRGRVPKELTEVRKRMRLDICSRRLVRYRGNGSSQVTVREFLDDTYKNHWCRRDGPIPWLANSPDLKPPDFFVWGYVKSLVYGQRPQNVDDLQQKITAAFAQITPEILRATWRNLSARYELCRARRGGHVEC
jgi:hypothetical protein